MIRTHTYKAPLSHCLLFFCLLVHRANEAHQRFLGIGIGHRDQFIRSDFDHDEDGGHGRDEGDGDEEDSNEEDSNGDDSDGDSDDGDEDDKDEEDSDGDSGEEDTGFDDL